MRSGIILHLKKEISSDCNARHDMGSQDLVCIPLSRYIAIPNDMQNQGIQQLETRPGCEETQEESIRTGPESVNANGAAIARERKMKLTPLEGTTVT
ncbi:hypothetical protein TNCV_785091 [Trichonephila clavipes]|nr:hypothetical protein TNCV_785091 [Trichonephila clavipes]